MELDSRLHELFLDRAKNTGIEILSIGLGYTAVTTSGGGIGLSYTFFGDKKSCMVLNKRIDYEGKSADHLLEKIKSGNTVERSMALALINALNYGKALDLPEDNDNQIMFDKFNVGKGTRLAMVGFFPPLVGIFEKMRVSLEVLDSSRGMGTKELFFSKLKDWAQLLLLTSTSILNSSTEEILAHAGPELQTVMLGPSTPMVAEQTLKAIRHGMGTPVLHRFSRKVFLDCSART